jgi:hypothetical protein
LTQKLDNVADQAQKPDKQSPPDKRARVSRLSIYSFITLIGLILVLFTGLLFGNLVQKANTKEAATPTTLASATPTATPDLASAFQMAKNPSVEPLTLPNGLYVLYAGQDKIYRVPVAGGTPEALNTPGYHYNRAVPPVLTPSGTLLYTTNTGVWSIPAFDGQAKQLASLKAGETITSLVLSQDGSHIAWSIAPARGTGTIRIYAGSLDAPELVYQSTNKQCPCFRAFAFLHGTEPTLLITDNRGDNRANLYGLWALSLSKQAKKEPIKLLDAETPEMPMGLAPDMNTLLYSDHIGMAPIPEDKNIPDDITALNNANSLSLMAIDGAALKPGSPQVLLPEQRNMPNKASYHWVHSFQFSPDGKKLTYVVFSSDDRPPFFRHSSLYTVEISGQGTQMHLGQPQLQATSNAHHVEVGPWLNDQVVTCYADGALYALDLQHGTKTRIVQTGQYASIIAILKH